MPAKACDLNAIKEAITGKLLRYYGVTVGKRNQTPVI